MPKNSMFAPIHMNASDSLKCVGPRVDILMATYNGAEHIEQQIDSILKQTYKNIRVKIRDDGSSDKTLDILKKYEEEFPVIIEVIRDLEGNLGTVQNFSALLSYSDAQYVLFCDQDDVWLPRKIELTLEKMQYFESEYGMETPVLVHSDLIVVDEELKPLSSSFWKYHGLDSRATSLNRMLVQNVVTGCTVMINNALKNWAYPFPENARLHDYWLALVATTFGKIGEIGQPLVLYRQHGKNQVGASKWPNVLLRSGGLLALLKKHKKGLDAEQLQAAAFLGMFSEKLNKPCYRLVDCFARFGEFGYVKRRYYMVKNKYYRTGMIRNLALFLLG